MIGACGCGGRADEPAAQPAADPMADEVQNIRLVGHNDLQGRESLLVAVRSDEANGNWAYVGHHENFYDETQKLNPITGKMEWNGTSILDVNDPANPQAGVAHPEREQRELAQRVGRLRLQVRRLGPRLPDSQFRVTATTSSSRSSTSRRAAPTRSRSHSCRRSPATPENSCGRGCGGTLIGRAHKGWWSQETGYFYSAAGEPGFRTTIAQIWDLKDPKQPKFVGRMWIPGPEGRRAGRRRDSTRTTRTWTSRTSASTSATAKRAGRPHSTLPIPAQPKLVWSLDLNPPHRGPHTVSPIVYDKVPNFGARCAAPHLCVRRGRSRRGAGPRAVPRRPVEELHARHHERDAPDPGQHLAGTGRRVLQQGRTLRAAPAGGNRQRPAQPVRGQAGVDRVFQRRRPAGGPV